MIEPSNDLSREALEIAIKVLGEDKRAIVMAIYRCGFVDGEMHRLKLARELLTETAGKVT